MIAEQADPPNPAEASRFQVQGQRRGVGDPCRSATSGTTHETC